MDLQLSEQIYAQLLQILAVILNSLVPTILQYIQQYYNKQPYHTSILSGHNWVLELLNGHPERIRTELGVHKHVFLALIAELHALGHADSKFVTLEEQLAIFLYASVTGLSVRHLGERFQRSNETISKYFSYFFNYRIFIHLLLYRYFQKITHIFASAPFYTKYVKQVTPNDPPSSYLQNNPKLWPYFHRALGAIDGSHIHLATPSYLHTACRNRKGFLSQNCLFVCSFDFLFSYALTGWEGSAADARVYEDAIGSDLVVPDGWYLLADAGFPHCRELLVPYHGVRYHLSEWGRANSW